MSAFRLSGLAALALAVLSGGVLFWASQAVQRAEKDYAHVRQAIDRGRESIRVLEAEWDYLNRPQRLESLAGSHLGLQPPDSRTIGVQMRWQEPQPQPPALSPPYLSPPYKVPLPPDSAASAGDHVSSPALPVAKPVSFENDSSASSARGGGQHKEERR